jgi:Holliday junction resolvasome RuvABC endonuclease subunit
VITPRATLPFSDRLLAVYDGLLALLNELRPDEVGRGVRVRQEEPPGRASDWPCPRVILLAARQHGAAIHEYTAPR